MTVRVNWVLALKPPPSCTVKVTVVCPVCPVVGTKVTVRLAPVPPVKMLDKGSKLWLDELAATVKFPTGTAASPTVNPIGAVGVSCGVLWGGIAEMVGKGLVTVMLTAGVDVVAAPWLSVALAV